MNPIRILEALRRRNQQGRAWLSMLVLLVSLFVAILFLPARIQAQPAGVSVEVVPTVIDLPAKEAVQARVVLRNATGDTLLNIRLSWFSNIVIQVDSDEETVETLAANSEHVWNVSLAEPGPRSVGSVYFRVDYTQQAQDTAATSQRVAFGALELRTQLVDALAEVRVQTALEGVTEQNPGQVYLVITNKTNAPIVIDKVVPKDTPYIDFDPKVQPVSSELQPYDSYTTVFSVTAKSEVLPGKQVLLFETTLNQAGYTRQVMTTHVVDVGIFGEPLIRTTLAIPSLFVLPGFLAIVTVSLVWGLRKTKEQRAGFLLPVASPEFWLVAITLSLITAVIYPLITGLLDEPRNYVINAYGLRDIVYVWFASIGLPLGLYILVAGAFHLIRAGIRKVQTSRAEAEARQAAAQAEAEARQAAAQAEARALYKAERTFTSHDGEIEALIRLAKRGQGIQLETVTLNLEGHQVLAFALDRNSRQLAEFWVAPLIVVDSSNATSQLREALNQQLSPNGTLKDLIALLQQGETANELTVQWQRIEGLEGPLRVAQAAVTGWQAAQSIVSLAD